MRRRVHRQVETILSGHGLQWQEEQGDFLLRFDSALVRISLSSWGAQELIRISSDVLIDVPNGRDAEVLERVNELNCAATLCRWAFYVAERVVGLEYDVLADHMQAPELMSALTSVARLSDAMDDRLQAEYGGRRAYDSV